MSDQSDQIKIYISLQEAAKLCSYSQEYLSLRARQGKLKSIKLGRNWVTTKKWLEEYLLHNGNGHPAPAVQLASTEPLKAAPSKPHAASLIEPPENLPVEPEFKISEISTPHLPRVYDVYPREVNAEGFLKSKNPLKILRFFKLISLKPLVRDSFIFAFVFTLIMAGGVFGKENFAGVYKDISPVGNLISGKVSDYSVKFLAGAQEIGQGLEKINGIISPKAKAQLGKISSQEIMISGNLVSVAQISESVFDIFKDYGFWTKRQGLAFSEKIQNSPVGRGYDAFSRNLKDKYLSAEKFAGEKGNFIKKGMFSLAEKINKSERAVKVKYSAVNYFFDKKITQIGGRISRLAGLPARGYGLLTDSLGRIYKYVSVPWRRIIADGEFFAGKKYFDELKSEIENFKKEPVIVRRIEVEKRVEPVKEITREIETVKQITKVDEIALADVRASLVYLEGEIGKRLYAPGGVISQTIRVTEPVQSPKIYQENGEIVLQTLGSGNVILSAATGLQLYGKQVVIESTSKLSPMIYLASNSRVGGDLTVTGSLTGGALSVSSIGASGDTSVGGDLTVVGSATISGNITISGTQTFSGVTAITASSTSAVLTVTQTGSGDILNLKDDSTEVFTVVDGGNVGVGTTTPAALFAVQGNAYIGTSSALYVDSGNTRVGIKTSSPNSLLHVKQSSDAAGGGMRLERSSEVTYADFFVPSGAGGLNDPLVIQHKWAGSGTAVNLVYFGRDGQVQFPLVSGFSGGTRVTINTRNDQKGLVINGAWKQSANLFEWVGSTSTDSAAGVINDMGRVGIGTTTPRYGYALDVFGDLAVGTSTASYGSASTTPALYVDSGDGGRIGIGTTTLAGLLTVGTTTPAFVVDPLGNVGVATTVPSSLFAVGGQCVTGDTRLRRRRRKSRGKTSDVDGETSDVEERDYVYDEVQIKDIQPGDEIASLDEKTGKIVYRKVNALLDMGVKQIFKLITESGRTIRTTINHPYLTKNGWTKVGRIKVGDEIAVPVLNQKVLHGAELFDTVGSGVEPRTFKSTEQVSAVAPTVGEYLPPAYRNEIITEFQKNNNLLTEQKVAISDTLEYVISADTYSYYSKPKNPVKWESDTLWDKIISIESAGEEQVYDIEVEGTHNFIGNGIFAHNTYMSATTTINSGLNVNNGQLFVQTGSSNVGIATTTPRYKLDVWGDMAVGTSTDTNNPALFVDSGNGGRIGIGTTTLAGLLTVGTTTPALVVAPNGYIGIGTTTPSEKLSLVAGNFLATPGNPILLAGVELSNTANDVYVSGRYAYVVHLSAGTDEFSIYDVSDPKTPIKVAGVDLGIQGRGIYVSGRYAYIVTGSVAGNEFVIYDISNPSSPSLAGGAELGANGNDIYVSGRYAYIAMNATAAGNEFRIFDVSDPSSPVELGGADFGTGGTGNGVHVSGRYAYVVHASTAGNDFVIFDISNPNSPTLLGGADLGGDGNKVYVSGRYAYITAAPASGNDFVIYNISNPSSPSLVGGAELGSSGSGVYVSGRYAYIVNSTTNKQLQVYDVSTSTSPFLVGEADLGAIGSSVYVSGRYAYTTAYTVDFNEFRIYDVLGLEAPSAMVHSLEAGNLQVRNDIITQGQLQVGGGINIGSGGLFTAGAVSIDFATNSTALTVTQRSVGDILNLYDGSTEIFTVVDGGSVGIGTTTPRYLLDVWGDIAFGTSTATSSTAVVPAFFVDTGDGPKIGIGTTTLGTNLLTVGTTTPSLVVTNNGNIGIGTTAPGTKLELSTPSGSNPAFRFTDGDIGQPFTAVGFDPEVTASTFAQLSVVDSNVGGLGINAFTDSNSAAALALAGYMSSASVTVPAIILTGWKSDGSTGRTAMTATDLILQVRTGASSLVTVQGGGNVGIGTTGPSSKLTVFGGDIKVGDGSATSTIYNGSIVLDYGISAATSTITATSTLASINADSGLLYVDSYLDRIGIATTTPRYKLDVWGDIAFGTSTATSSTAVVPAFFVDTGDGPKIGIGTTTLGTNLLTVGTTTPSLVVTNNGNVGIGTAAPTGSLTIANSATLSGVAGYHINSGDSATLYISPNTVNTAATAQKLIFRTLDSSDNDNMWRNRLTFEGGDADTQNVYFENSNVGIGTAGPSSKLTVFSGNIAVGGGTSTTTITYGATGAATSTFAGDISALGVLSVGDGTSTSTLRGATAATSTISSGLTVGNNAAFVVNQAATANSLYIAANGRIGIATSTPRYALDVWGSVAIGTSTSPIFFADTGANGTTSITIGADISMGSIQVASSSGAITFMDMIVEASASAGTEESYSFQIDSDELFRIYAESNGTGGIQNKRIFSPSGVNFAIATTSPRYTLDVWGDIAVGTSTGVTVPMDYPMLYANTGEGGLNNGVGIGTTTVSGTLLTVGTTTPALVVSQNGWVGIGTATPRDALEIIGDIRTSACASDGAGDVACVDVAENYPVSEQVMAGDVVSLAGEDSKLRKSQTAYEKNIIGVVSTRPAILIEKDQARFGAPRLPGVYEAESQAPVALVGRVPVKVSLENGDIKAGDYLTSSGIPGAAMKADGAGRVIGIALEPFDGNSSSTDGIGKIMVFINPHWQGNDLSVEQNGEGQLVNIRVQQDLASVGLVVNDYGVLEVGTLKTQELCVGSVCVTEEDFMRVFGASLVDEPISGTSTPGVDGETPGVNPETGSSDATTEEVIIPDLPNSTIDSGPEPVTTSTEASFAFHSNKDNSTFTCQLDFDMWQGCESPKTYTDLTIGLHQFSVMAMEPNGEAEPSPSIYEWEIVTPTIATTTESIITSTSTESMATTTVP